MTELRVLDREMLRLLEAHDPETCSACERERRETVRSDQRVALLAVQVDRLRYMSCLLTEVEFCANEAASDNALYGLVPEEETSQNLEHVRASAAIARDYATDVINTYNAERTV